MNLLESPQNPRFKCWRSLMDAKGIKKQGLYLISGSKLIPEAIEQGVPIEAVILREGKDSSEVPSALKGQLFHLISPLYEDLDIFGTDGPILVAKTPELEELSPNVPPQGLEVIVPLGDPANMGAILRAAEAFGVSRVILTQEACHPFHPKSVRASSGSCWRVPMVKGPTIASFSQPDLALSMNGDSIFGFQWPKNVRLLLGEEGPGLPSNIVPQKTLMIPMQGKVDSLNAVSAATLAFAKYFESHLI